MIEQIARALEERGKDEAYAGLSPDGEPDWQRSGHQVLARAGAWQRWLQARGVLAGERVVLDLPRGPELLPAHVAVLALGACAVPLNSALTPAERERVLARAEPRAALTAAESPGPDAPLQLREGSAGAPALLIFTSGTTGEPKGVPLSLANLEANLRDLAQVWELSPADRLLHVLPAHHVHGLVLALYGSARLGIPVALLPRFEVQPCLHALARAATTLFMAVPTIYHRLAQAPDVPPLPGMRLFVSGSAPLAHEDFSAFRARFGHAPLERYGLSETLILSSNPLRAERRAGTVGHALPGVQIRLAADGEIEARGDAVFAGYWRDPAGTREAFSGEFFRTGDLGEHDEAGYLRICGRKKELILVGGSNVLPGEVEAALRGDPDVDELAAAGLPDRDRGEIVAAFVVLHAGSDAAHVERRLRERAEAHLAPYKRPLRYAFLPMLPRNAMGKIDRRTLRELAQPG